MKTIYIKDACCGIKIECPDEYSCMLINEYHDQESILRLTKPLAHNKDALMIDICFNSLGELSDSRNCRINSSEYSYIMKNHKTNITSYRCCSINSQGNNAGYDYQDDVYLTDQLEPINAVLNNHGVKIETWFIRSDIACSKMVWSTVGEHSGDLTEYIPNRKTLYARAKNIINSIYGVPNGSSKCWDELKTNYALTDIELISKKNSKEAYNKRIFSEIKDIIINDPATIILWKDGTKTIVKCQPVDTFDPEKGIAMAILKKLYGNSGFYKDIFEPAIDKYELKKSLEKSKKHVATKKEKKYTVK